MPKKTQHPTPDPPRVSVLMATQTPTSKSKLTPGQELCEIQRSEPIPPTSGCPISKSTHSDGSPVGYPIRMLRFVCGGVSVIARVPGGEGGKPAPPALSGKFHRPSKPGPDRRSMNARVTRHGTQPDRPVEVQVVFGWFHSGRERAL